MQCLIKTSLQWLTRTGLWAVNSRPVTSVCNSLHLSAGSPGAFPGMPGKCGVIIRCDNPNFYARDKISSHPPTQIPHGGILRQPVGLSHTSTITPRPECRDRMTCMSEQAHVHALGLPGPLDF